MDLRLAASNDIPAIHSLVERAYRGDSARRGWTHEADLLGGQRTDRALLAEMIADPHQHLLIAGPDGDPFGCVALTDKGQGRVYLGLFTVDPARQGGGIGHALLTAAEQWARATLGAGLVEMTVIVQREALIEWYARRGYRLTGERRPFPYGDRRAGDPRRDDLEFVVLEKALG